MSAPRGAMPLMRLQWQEWGVIVVVLALAVATALLLMAEQGR